MKLLATIVLALMLTIPSPVQDTHNKDSPADKWISLGECRITCYCPVCNDGQGYESSSGKTLRYGHAACRWLPNGTKIAIGGDIFEIVDTCGTDAIDIFIDTGDTRCRCNLNEYQTVYILKKGGEKNGKDGAKPGRSCKDTRDKYGHSPKDDRRRKNSSVQRRAKLEDPGRAA